MKKLVLIAALLLASIAGAKAQTAQTISAEYKAEVVKLLDATHGKKIFTSTIGQMWTSIGMPNAAKVATAVADDLWPDLIEVYAEEYHKHLDLSDLQSINAFYKTPTGIKLCDSLGAINSNVMKTVQNRFATRIQNLVRENVESR